MDFEIDHVIVLCPDLERAASQLETLGFTLSEKSSHPFGTANRLVWLGTGFLELLTVEDPDRLGGFSLIQELLDRTGCDTPWGLIWQMEDPQRMHEFCVRCGFEPSSLEHRVRRSVTHPDGVEHEVCYSSFALQANLMPGYLEGFSVQHRPEATFAPDWRRHANGAVQLTAVHVDTDEIEECHQHLATLSEELLEAGLGGLAFGNGRSRLLVTERERDAGMPGPRIVAVDIACANLAAAKGLVEAAGLPFEELRCGAVVVPAPDAAGLEIRLLQDIST